MSILSFFSRTGEYIAVDGYARFEPVDDTSAGMPPVHTENLEPFFNPRGIAVIGVSRDLTKGGIGVEIALKLHQLGRRDIYFINPRGGSLQLQDTEYPLYRDINDITEKVELIVYAAPASRAAGFLSTLPPDRYRSLIFISGIPADVSYDDYVQELDKSVPPGLRIIGPNCIGIISTAREEEGRVNTFFLNQKWLKMRFTPMSNTVLLAQSGGFAISEIDRLQNANMFRALVSFGNKYDVKITDFIAYFNQRSDVKVIALYVEGFDPGEGRRFFELARAMDKPVIIYKSGRTETGAQAAATHTASMSGDYDVFSAVCTQAGVVLTEDIEDHYNYIKAFSLLSEKKLRGPRVAGVVNSGFEATVAGDEIGSLVQAELTGVTRERLEKINKSGLVAITSTFLDISPMSDDQDYADYIEVLMQDDKVDSIFVSVIPHLNILKTDPERFDEPGSLGNQLVRIFRTYDKPMVVSVNAGNYYSDFVSLMEENGVPVFSDIRAAMHALDMFVSHNLEK